MSRTRTGPPAIPIARPSFGGNELRYLRAVLDSGWVTQGPWVTRLEAAVARFTGSRHAVAVNSCTSAQMLAAEIAGLGPGDEAVVPAFTWISTANSVVHRGATPVLADVDLATFNLDPAAAARALSPRTRALLPVHLFGCPADMAAVLRLARPRRLAVIEDCACSLGGFIGRRHTGTFGDCGCFSLHPRKSVTTGEGGVLVTASARIAREASALRNHGALGSDAERHAARRSWRLPRYPRVGYNYRLSDLQGAVGVAQLERLAAILRSRRLQAAWYGRRLRGVPNLRLPAAPPGCTHGWQAYVCLLGPPGVEEDERAVRRWNGVRTRVMDALEADGIATRPGTHAVHLQEWYRRRYGFRPMDFPRAFAADRLSLALPLFPALARRDQERVIALLRRELARAS